MIEAKLHIFGSRYCDITRFLRTYKVGLTRRFKSFSAIFKTITLVIKLMTNTTSFFFSILKIMSDSDSIAYQNYTEHLIYSKSLHLINLTRTEIFPVTWPLLNYWGDWISKNGEIQGVRGGNKNRENKQVSNFSLTSEGD